MDGSPATKTTKQVPLKASLPLDGSFNEGNGGDREREPPSELFFIDGPAMAVGEVDVEDTKLPPEPTQLEDIPATTVPSEKFSSRMSLAPDDPSLIVVAVFLPDNTYYRSLMSFTEPKTAAELLKVICEKTGLGSSEEFEFLESVKHGDNPVKLDEDGASMIKRITESNNRLRIRKKRAPQQQRRLNFGSIRGRSNSSMSSNEDSTVSAPAAAPSGATVRRRMSITETIMAKLTGGKDTQSEQPKPFDIFEVMSRTMTPENSKHISDLSTMERRGLMMFLGEYVSKYFEGTDGANLNFNRLNERNRFMSWSRNALTVKSAEPQITKIFGVPLSTLMESQNVTDPSSKVPLFFRQCLIYLEERALHTPGIFRISGVSRKIKALREEIDNGREPSLYADDCKPHDVTGLLKLFFRELPDPILTFKLFDFYVTAARSLVGDKLDQVIKLLSWHLPIQHIHLLEDFLKLLSMIASNAGSSGAADPMASPSYSNVRRPYSIAASDMSGSDAASDTTEDRQRPSSMVLSRAIPSAGSSSSAGGNKMTATNLAIVVTPTLLRSKEEKADQMLIDNDSMTRVLERMIEMSGSLFLVPNDLLAEMTRKEKQ